MNLTKLIKNMFRRNTGRNGQPGEYAKTEIEKTRAFQMANNLSVVSTVPHMSESHKHFFTQGHVGLDFVFPL